MARTTHEPGPGCIVRTCKASTLALDYAESRAGVLIAVRACEQHVSTALEVVKAVRGLIDEQKEAD